MSSESGKKWLRRIWRGVNPAASSRWVLALAVVIALGAALAVTHLHRLADGGRQNQLILASIDDIADDLRLLEAEPMGTGRAEKASSRAH